MFVWLCPRMKMPTANYTDWADFTEIQISESAESDRIGVIRGKDPSLLGKAGLCLTQRGGDGAAVEAFVAAERITLIALWDSKGRAMRVAVRPTVRIKRIDSAQLLTH